MRQLTLIISTLTLTTLTGCSFTGSSTPIGQPTAITSTMTPEESIAPDGTIHNNTINTTGNKENNKPITGTQKVTGFYQTYTKEGVTASLAQGRKVILFFHSEQCESCKNLDNEINANDIPDGVTVFKVNYDTSDEIKQQYGVITQHTLVRIDSSQNLIQKTISGDYKTIIDLIQY